VIGAGAGLSTSAGFIYTGERFQKYFQDFAEKYHFKDMYSGGFYPYDTLEEHWAYWSRYIYVNRYMNPPKPVYDRLFELVKDKDYFVLTTNVDHCFQKAGFDKHRMFYTQGDYGLFQCSEPCHKDTYDNEEMVQKMIEAQGFEIVQAPVEVPGEGSATAQTGTLSMTENGIHAEPATIQGMSSRCGTSLRMRGHLSMTVPSELVPHCPKCGKPMSMNLRADNTFVEDEGWHIHAGYYSEFLRRHQNVKTLFLELGVGFNTPGIIKYNFWHMVNDWPDATYACLNYGEAFAPDEIAKKSICINDDIGNILEKL
jgi:NAD-dependent SIR2 family protein deacetylase